MEQTPREIPEKRAHTLSDGRITLGSTAVIEQTDRQPHRLYTIAESDGECATFIDVNFEDGSTYTAICHHLGDVGWLAEETDWEVPAVISLSELHELTHWGLLPEERDSLAPSDEHSPRWNPVLIDILEHVSGENLPDTFGREAHY